MTAGAGSLAFLVAADASSTAAHVKATKQTQTNTLKLQRTLVIPLPPKNPYKCSRSHVRVRAWKCAITHYIPLLKCLP